MRILVLTTAMEEDDFLSYAASVERKPNPAGQNFYDRLIKALAKQNRVKVLSYVPNCGFPFPKKENRKEPITYSYVNPFPNAFTRLFYQKRVLLKKAKELLGGSKIDAIFYDSLVPFLAEVASALHFELEVPSIAVCTDDPRNISFARADYAKAVLEASNSASAYFCLTKGLNDLFNPKGRPVYYQPGILEDMEEQPRPYEKPFLYYGGALFEKDGTADLLKAMESLPLDYDLLIAGHGPMEETIKAASNPRIHFLGQISKEENYAYQQHADFVLNPRHYNPELDACSVPSKVLEALANAKGIITCYSQAIEELAGESVAFLPKEEDGFLSFLKDHLTPEGKLTGIPENFARKTVQKEIGLSATSENLQAFLLTL